MVTAVSTSPTENEIFSSLTSVVNTFETGLNMIFSAIVDPKPYINRYGGYLLRVKPAVSDEGGVAAGYAVLSSPDLFD